MIDILMELLQRILKDGGITWGAVITLVILLRKRIRNKRLDERDKYRDALIEAVAKKVGVSWEDANLRALRSLASRPKESFGSSILTFARSVAGRRAYRFITNLNLRRVLNMKDYLKKLTKTKFQAFLIVTITNIIILIGSLTGNIQLEGKIDEWMPAINIVVQLIASAVYQWVEGRIDVESQKQNVYVVDKGGDRVEENSGDHGAAV